MKRARSGQHPSSIYPLKPKGSETIVRYGENEMTTLDQCIVWGTSLFFIGGVVWVPALYAWAIRRFKRIPKEQRKRRAVYMALILAATALMIGGPHRSARFGSWLKLRKWKLWQAWLRFCAFEIVADQGYDSVKETIDKQAIVTVSPHGVFPVGLALSTLGAPEKAFGYFRVVVASATQALPWVRDVLRWINTVDATRSSVDAALAQGDRLGIAPGGIAEMFEGYPKPGTHPDEEYTIIRKGIFKMAVQYGIPVVPVYCFGSSKLLRRLQLPSIVEKISLLLRVSLVVFYGKWFLPIPFRQKLLYVIGRPIYPESSPGTHAQHNATQTQQVDEMLERYCEEMIRIFDRQKESYGWAHKTLKILRR